MGVGRVGVRWLGHGRGNAVVNRGKAGVHVRTGTQIQAYVGAGQVQREGETTETGLRKDDGSGQEQGGGGGTGTHHLAIVVIQENHSAAPLEPGPPQERRHLR